MKKSLVVSTRALILIAAVCSLTTIAFSIDKSPVEHRNAEIDDTLSYPSEMPATPYPDLKGCSSSQESYLKKAWRQAHYFTWRADKLMDYIMSQDPSERGDLWTRDFVAGENSSPSPRKWFGPYNSDRASKARDAIDKARKRFENKGDIVKGIKTLRCGQPIAPAVNLHTDVCPSGGAGPNGSPSAYHAPVGVIVTCGSFWNAANNKFQFPNERLDSSAHTLVHEIFHWLSVDGKYVTDLHGGLSAKHKYYGKTKSLSLAETKADWAIFNNDNYAWFTYYVARHEQTFRAVWGPKDPGGTGGLFVGISWDQLVSYWKDLAPNQYLNDVKTYVNNGERKYIASWRVGKGNGALWDSKWDEFVDKWNELKKTQDLIDIEMYQSGGQWRFLGVFKKKESGSVGDGGLLRGLSWEELVAKRKQLANVAYLADVETYVENGQRKFIGVWRTGNGTGSLYITTKWTDFSDTKKKLNPTQQLIDVEVFLSTNGIWNYMGVWQTQSASGPIHSNLTLTELLAKWNELKATNTLLEVEEYSALPLRIK